MRFSKETEPGSSEDTVRGLPTRRTIKSRTATQGYPPEWRGQLPLRRIPEDGFRIPGSSRLPEIWSVAMFRRDPGLGLKASGESRRG